MDKSLGLKIQEEEFIFDCRRTIYWPARQALIATDLHWGKTSYMQQHGIAISDRIFEEDLRRLSQVLQDYDVKTFIVLGDMVHHEKSLTPEVIQRITSFRQTHPCELILIKGNHDRYTQFPDSWEVVEKDELFIPPFSFTHQQQSQNKNFQFSGHLHPMMRFKAGNDHLRLPTFIVTDTFCLLPAFSHLTGGLDVKLEKNQKAIAVLSDGLMLFEK